jgi:hypothetical protein
MTTWIANAAAGLTGHYGAVTHQADRAECSRQTIYDHAQKVQAAIEDAHDGGPTRAQLIERNQHLAQENAQFWDWLAQTIEFPPEKRREFTVTAAAMGLSLNQIVVLLALILGERAGPGRSPKPVRHGGCCCLARTPRRPPWDTDARRNFTSTTSTGPTTSASGRLSHRRTT